MNGLAFLLVALVLSVLGSLVLWLHHREPTSLDSAIDEFSREMQALAPQTRRVESRAERARSRSAGSSRKPRRR